MLMSTFFPFTINDAIFEPLGDISSVMHSRALAGYGIDLMKLKEQDGLPQNLKRLWTWVKRAKTFDAGFEFERDDVILPRLVGVKTIIKGFTTGECQRSDHSYSQWVGLEYGTSGVSHLRVPHYRSEDRIRALSMCGWDGDIHSGNIQNLIGSLTACGMYTRAAAIAVFNLRLKRAISVLVEGSKASVDANGDPYLSTVAMALSGYSDRSPLWKENCKNLRSQLKDSYLKAIFTFLTCDNNDYDEILKDEDLLLLDRIAFAVNFLSDHSLLIYLESETTRLVRTGDLDGLMLTGMTDEGLQLIQNYVEQSCDIQTACLLILHSLPTEDYKDPRAKSWVEGYRDLLDQWRLWHERAFFDNEWYKRLSNESPPRQLFISCTFCDKNVSSYLGLVGRAKNNLEQQQQQLQMQQQFQAQQYSSGKVSVSSSNNKIRIQSCPNCRKALPRCALCLTHLGTPALHWRSSDICHIHQEPSKKKSPFSDWFTWCQTCRHGGHSQHILNWFKEHTECPVSGCLCKCMSVDNVSKINNTRSDHAEGI
ncbi:GATOR complex protein MIOS [Halotydeus destructor]|nr:GATOR complex protein MIOS [Halotydeus destructor]